MPTPVVHTRLRAPASRMGPADDVDGAAKASALFAKYGARVDAESARELLAERLERSSEASAPEKGAKPRAKRREAPRPPAPEGGAEALGKFLNSREGKAVQRKVLRGV